MRIPTRKTLTAVALAACLSTTLFANAASATASPAVVAPTSRVGGMTYGQWSAAQWAWYIGATDNQAGQIANTNAGTASHPSAVDCSIGNSGNVWFLAGSTFGAPTSPIFRSCAVPAGTFLFFPIIDAWADDLNCPGQPPFPFTAAELQAIVGDQTDTIVPGSMSLTIDGKSVAGLTDSSTAFRAQANGFSYTLPANNELSVVAGCAFPAGTTPPPPGAFADGVYVMVPPLSVGTHQLHWTGAETGAPGSPFFGPISQDISYTITVTQR